MAVVEEVVEAEADEASAVDEEVVVVDSGPVPMPWVVAEEATLADGRSCFLLTPSRFLIPCITSPFRYHPSGRDPLCMCTTMMRGFMGSDRLVYLGCPFLCPDVQGFEGKHMLRRETNNPSKFSSRLRTSTIPRSVRVLEEHTQQTSIQAS